MKLNPNAKRHIFPLSNGANEERRDYNQQPESGPCVTSSGSTQKNFQNSEAWQRR